VSFYPSPENYRRNVVEASEWAVAHLSTLQAIFRTFARDADWPQIEPLQREMDRDGLDIDLVSELQQMPPSLGGGRIPSPAHLTVRGLRAVPQATGLLDGFMAVIRLAVERYHGEEPEPTVTEQDLRALGLTGREAVLVAQVVIGEGWPFAGGSSDASGHWTRNVGRELRYLTGARTVDEFLEVQATLRYGPQPPAVHDGSSGAEGRTDATPTMLSVSPWAAKSEQGEPGHVTPERVEPTTHEAEAQPPHMQPPKPARDGRLDIPRPLSDEAFIRLAFKALAQAGSEDLGVEAFDHGDRLGLDASATPYEPPCIPDPERWLMMSFGRARLWEDLRNPAFMAVRKDLGKWIAHRELMLAYLELWHRDVASMPAMDDQGWEGYFDRAAGQARFRELLAPILELLDPPLVMRANGQIVERDDPALEGLTERPLPDTQIADDARDRVVDATRRFRERGASTEEQRLALVQLAGVLEQLRSDERLKRALSNKTRRRYSTSPTTSGYATATTVSRGSTDLRSGSGYSTPSSRRSASPTGRSKETKSRGGVGWHGPCPAPTIRTQAHVHEIFVPHLFPVEPPFSSAIGIKSAAFAGYSLVGETGFEPATARPPAGCATRLRHSPWLSSGRRESNPL
jgi:hypothetical protein